MTHREVGLSLEAQFPFVRRPMVWSARFRSEESSCCHTVRPCVPRASHLETMSTDEARSKLELTSRAKAGDRGLEGAKLPQAKRARASAGAVET